MHIVPCVAQAAPSGSQLMRRFDEEREGMRTLCVGTRSLSGYASHCASVQLMSRVILPGCPAFLWLYTMPSACHVKYVPHSVVNTVCTLASAGGGASNTTTRIANDSTVWRRDPCRERWAMRAILLGTPPRRAMRQRRAGAGMGDADGRPLRRHVLQHIQLQQ